MDLIVRPITPQDVPRCGQICYQAFLGISQAHGFALDFPEEAAGTQVVGFYAQHPEIYGVVAESAGQILGSNFLDERDAIRGLGPITVDPTLQKKGTGRALMEAVLERGRQATGIRLLQDAFNMQSMTLYVSLGFEVKEPLVLLNGRAEGTLSAGFEVRALTEPDVEACNDLCHRVHGWNRNHELRDAVKFFSPVVVKRQGRVTAYATVFEFWGHGVAETEEDFQSLLLGASQIQATPLAFLMPTRQGRLLRWCLGHGFKVVKPMNLMALGKYQEPKAVFFPSIAY